jgi:mono/diheme cytochrome c family protein
MTLSGTSDSRRAGGRRRSEPRDLLSIRGVIVVGILLVALVTIQGCGVAPGVSTSAPLATAAPTETSAPQPATPTLPAPPSATPSPLATSPAPTFTTTAAASAAAPPATSTAVPPTNTVAPPAPTNTAPSVPVGDAANGAALWPNAPCQGCHGNKAQGGSGPRLAGTSRDFNFVMRQVRSGGSRMPAFSPSRISDQDLRDIYAWLSTLAAK